MSNVKLIHGDCLDVLRTLPDASVDAVVTDPPYGLEFMGKAWDGADGFRRSLNPAVANRDNAFGRTSRTSPEYRAGSLFQEWCEAWTRECLRVLKPGGHLLAFGGTRTWHRLAVAVEDAGFEVRDSIAWMYGSGFPKSLDVSKAIDKAAGVERGEGVPYVTPGGGQTLTTFSGWGENGRRQPMITRPATDAAQDWQGWGTALKPAFEPIVVARKPLVGTVAANVLAHGTGALNVDGCRVSTDGESFRAPQSDPTKRAGEVGRELGISNAAVESFQEAQRASIERTANLGRWPANVVLDESQAEVLDERSGILTSGKVAEGGFSGEYKAEVFGRYARNEIREETVYGDSGGASRFFYVAKADASERVRVNGTAHPTVKPLALMRWLVRLVTPPGGTVLEPFAGSGTTVEACILEGFDCIAIEREVDYLPLIQQRIDRRRDPVAAVRATGDDGGLFDLLGDGAA